MSELVFLLEELSAREMLRGLLPRLLPDDIAVRYIVFEGKSDLDSQMIRRLRHYRVPGARFVVLRDKDAADELERLTQGRYQKVGGSRAIGPHLDPDNNRSHSFAVFVAGLKRLVAGQ